ncbi:MAG: hypothetical protein KDA71_12535 [Planctomycetales bacterium]|nr:hypothetical protein [Planctomycetales bacterium]
MPNRSGQAYGLTALSPIIRDTGRTPAHETEIREFLGSLDREENSPFSKIPTMHLCRWTVIDDVPYQAHPAHEEHLKSKYLMFTANFDGDRDTTLALMAEHIPDTLNAIYRHCVGFEPVGVGNSQAFCRYIARCQITTSLFFADYPDARLSDVLRALQLQREFVPTMARLQGQSPAQVQQQFLAFAERMQNAPIPRPGTM